MTLKNKSYDFSSIVLQIIYRWCTDRFNMVFRIMRLRDETRDFLYIFYRWCKNHYFQQVFQHDDAKTLSFNKVIGPGARGALGGIAWTGWNWCWSLIPVEEIQTWCGWWVLALVGQLRNQQNINKNPLGSLGLLCGSPGGPRFCLIFLDVPFLLIILCWN